MRPLPSDPNVNPTNPTTRKQTTRPPYPSPNPHPQPPCPRAPRVQAWNFASAGCPKGQACELKSEDLLPVDADRDADGPRCNRTSGAQAAAQGLVSWLGLDLDNRAVPVCSDCAVTV